MLQQTAEKIVYILSFLVFCTVRQAAVITGNITACVINSLLSEFLPADGTQHRDLLLTDVTLVLLSA